MNKPFFYIVFGIVLVVMAVTMFMPQLELTLLLSCLLVSCICAFTIHTVKYDSMSFVSIYLLMNIVTYSLAILGNMLLLRPAVRFDLWAEVYFAVQGAIVGLSAFSFGVWTVNKISPGKDIFLFSALLIPITKIKFNVLLSVIPLFCVVAIQMALGLYLHSSVGEYQFSNAMVNNGLSYLLWIGYIGIFLQLYRVAKHHNIDDVVISIVLIGFAILLFLPSGSRERAFGFLPLLVLAYLAWEKKSRYAYLFFAVISSSLIVGILVVGLYRVSKGVRETSFTEKLSMIEETVLVLNQDSASLLVGRLSDFAPVGRIIHWTPQIKPYRYFDGMQDWWRIILPGMARNYFDLPLNFNEGAETTYEYRVSMYKTSSNPSMNIGSLYSRFGWIGMSVCMFFLGALLRKFDYAFSRQHPLFRFIFWLLFARTIWRLYTSSSLILFVTFTRDIIIMYVLSLLIYKILIKIGAIPICGSATSFSRRFWAGPKRRTNNIKIA